MHESRELEVHCQVVQFCSLFCSCVNGYMIYQPLNLYIYVYRLFRSRSFTHFLPCNRSSSDL